MANVGGFLAQYGQQPSLLEGVDEAKRARLVNRLGELQIQQAQMANTKQGRLADLYQRHTMGDQGAQAEIAGVDPAFHMQLQERMMAMDEAARKRAVQQSIGLSQQIMLARDNPRMQAELQQIKGITPDMYDQVLARTAVIPEVYTAITNADQQSYTRNFNQTQQDLQRRGQDITMRGQDITARGQEGQKPTGDQRKYQELLSLGVPENVARGVAYGAYRNVTDPASGATLIIDLTTNQPIGRMVPSDPSKPYTSGYRWEPVLNTGTIQRNPGQTPGQPVQDASDPLGLFK